MPVYEYECKACHRDFEYQQRMADPEKTTCEVCGGELERLISRTAFQLKGSGWYKDLYSSSKPAGDTKASSDSKDTASSESSSADKPAAKTDGGGGSGGSTPSTPPASSGGSSTPPASSGGGTTSSGGGSAAASAS